jgi:hypothetical protein
MAEEIDLLWREYQQPFSEFDDITLARWLAQTLSQLNGKVWRMSHPLVSAYRAAAEVGNDRQIWLKRLASIPSDFTQAECCRAPLLPFFSRDIVTSGLVCQHCGGTAVNWEDLPKELQMIVEPWAREYSATHAVAHYTEEQSRECDDYDEEFEEAATRAEEQLRKAAHEILPRFLSHYNAMVWEDQDQCLEVEPKDIATWSET